MCVLQQNTLDKKTTTAAPPATHLFLQRRHLTCLNPSVVNTGCLSSSFMTSKNCQTMLAVFMGCHLRLVDGAVPSSACDSSSMSTSRLCCGSGRWVCSWWWVWMVKPSCPPLPCFCDVVVERRVDPRRFQGIVWLCVGGCWHAKKSHCAPPSVLKFGSNITRI